MYSVKIINDDELYIHFPNTDEIKLLACEVTKNLNVADILKSDISIMNQGYGKLYEKKTKVEVIDENTGEYLFTGRVLKVKENMDSEGVFIKKVICESTLNYLQDTHTREYEFKKVTISSIFDELLSKHNEKVDDSRKIYKGNIEVEGTRTFMTSFETTLEALKKYVIMSGQLLIRRENNKNYLDYLNEYEKNICEVNLGENLIDIEKENNEIFSRIIPVGRDNLKITNVNGGKEYLEDFECIDFVVEKVVDYPEIDDDIELKKQAEKDLYKYTRPNFSFSINAVDLSYITSCGRFDLNSKVKVKNAIMGVEHEAKVIQIVIDLLKPHNPKLTISTKEEQKKNIVSKIVESNKNIKSNFSGVKRLNIKAIELQTGIEQTDEKIELKASELLNGIQVNASLISQTAQAIRLEVSDLENNISSSITQTAQSINLRVDDVSNDLNTLSNRVSSAELKITNDSIVSTVTESLTYKGLEDKVQSNTSVITQTSESINLRVDSVVNDISSLESRISSAELKITDSAIVSTVTNSTKYKTDIDVINSSITQTATSIRSEVSQIETNLDNKITSNKTSITQTSNKIALVVDSSNRLKGSSLIAAINMSSEKIEASAVNIDLNGFVTITNLSGNGTTTINGSNITTGDIDGLKVTVKNINANNIVTGTITANIISGGTLDFSKVTATNIEIEDDLHIGDALYLNIYNNNNKGIYLANGKSITAGTNNKMVITSNSGVEINTGYNSYDIKLSAYNGGDIILDAKGSYGGKVIFDSCIVDFSNVYRVDGLVANKVYNSGNSSYPLEFKTDSNRNVLYWKAGAYGSWHELTNI